MGKIIEYCAGIDIGKRFLLCCLLKGGAQEEPRSQTLRFDVTVPGLIRLRDWLVAEKVTHVVMESTGSYWIPVFNILEDHFVVVLANPEEVKNRKGTKQTARTLSIWQSCCVTTTSDPVTFRPSRSVTCVILRAGACN
jgi:transposase